MSGSLSTPARAPYLPLPWHYANEGNDSSGGDWGNIFSANGKMVAEAIYRKDADVILSALAVSESETRSAAAWAEVEKAKADAYEAAALICEEMGYPPEGRDTHASTDAEWAAIKLEDAAKAIRERKARVCHVTQAATQEAPK